MKRNIYLNTVTLEAAIACFEEKTAHRFSRLIEEIPVQEAYGRTTAEPVYALCSNPHYNAAAMDGISVCSEKTLLANERNPLHLTINEDFIYVDTGDILQPPFDSVIMIEDLEVVADGVVEILQPSHPWEHVRMVGEDFVIGEMLLTSNHKITPVDLGALISGGISRLKVYAKTRVGLIPTGSEIVEVGGDLRPGDILESNTSVFAGLVIEGGGIPKRYPIVKDDQAQLKACILKAVKENDLVIINAGSSAGREDYTAALMDELGEVWVHGIDIKPGKPTILGAIDQVPVVGIPGYPVSAYMTFKHFVMPLLNPRKSSDKKVMATLSQGVPSSLKHKEFIRLQLGYVNDHLIGTPLKRGAASTMSLVKANGILTVDKASEGFMAGARVQVEMTRDHLDLHKGLVSIGSHDLIMDWISDLLVKEKRGTYLLSAHVGSLGGILAINRGEAHVAPIHLLDEASGIYNLKHLDRYLSKEAWILVKGIKRWQGFYMAKDAPMIEDFKDLVTKKLTFVNRQRGSGTRLLTDYFMKKQAVDPTRVLGYKMEVLTHTAVASAVLSGNAHVGLGIESVARQMGLQYKPLAKEDYDFLIPKKYMDLKIVKDFLAILNHEDFKAKLQEIGGYDLEPITYLEIGGK